MMLLSFGHSRPFRTVIGDFQLMDEQFDSVVATATVPRTRTRRDQKPKRQPRYHVILWNDDDHSYDYVIGMLSQLFGHPQEQSFQLAESVDSAGRAIVLTTTKEHAEFKCEQIHAFGKDKFIAGCKGSMSSSIEPEQ